MKIVSTEDNLHEKSKDNLHETSKRVFFLFFFLENKNISSAEKFTQSAKR